MRRQRSKGTGSIFQRKDGLWVASIEAGYTTKGKRRQIRLYASTKKDVTTKLQDKRREIQANGIPDEAATKAATVKHFVDQWLKIRHQKVSQSAYLTDRSALAKWVVPVIGHIKLANLSAAHIRAVHENMQKNKMAQNSIARTHVALMKMLKTASAEGCIIPVGVFHVQPPKRGESKRGAISLEDVRKILTVAASHRRAARWYAAFFLGLRPAEALGLTWECVDFENDVVRVEWQLKQLRKVKDDPSECGYYIPEGAQVRELYLGYHLVRPKTGAGVRVLPLIEPVRSMLLAQREHGGDGLVWARDNGRPYPDKLDRLEWKGLCAVAGVRAYDLYEARHTAATVLRDLGAREEVVELIMGHAAFASSRAYIHPDLVAARVALGQVAGRLIGE